jgi:hypothetical protein
MTAVVDEPLRPRGWWYGVGGGIIAVGLIAAVVIFAVAFQDTFDEFREIEREVEAFQRVPAPGDGTITLPEPGEYTVYVEGSFDASDPVSAPEIEIESVEPDSQPLALRPADTEFTYDFSGPAVHSVFDFTAPDAGDYRVDVGEPPFGVSGVAVGEDPDILGAVGSILIAVFVPMGVGGLFLILGLVVIIITAVRRSKAQRLRRQATFAGGYGSAPPPPPTWSGPPPPPAPPPAP